MTMLAAAGPCAAVAHRSIVCYAVTTRWGILPLAHAARRCSFGERWAWRLAGVDFWAWPRERSVLTSAFGIVYS